jgi:hypothetical protein
MAMKNENFTELNEQTDQLEVISLGHENSNPNELEGVMEEEKVLIIGTEPGNGDMNKNVPASMEVQIISLDQVTRFKNLFISVHPFIFHGYRIYHKTPDCLRSIFTLHNETLNIWSHLIPFLGFLVVFIYDLSSKIFYLKRSDNTSHTWRNHLSLCFHISYAISILSNISYIQLSLT